MVIRFIILLVIVAFAIASHVYLWCNYLDTNRNAKLSKVWWLAIGLFCELVICTETLLIFLINISKI